jgi:hypothetical protein
MTLMLGAAGLALRPAPPVAMPSPVLSSSPG